MTSRQKQYSCLRSQSTHTRTHAHTPPQRAYSIAPQISGRVFTHPKLTEPSKVSLHCLQWKFAVCFGCFCSIACTPTHTNHKFAVVCGAIEYTQRHTPHTDTRTHFTHRHTHLTHRHTHARTHTHTHTHTHTRRTESPGSVP